MTKRRISDDEIASCIPLAVKLALKIWSTNLEPADLVGTAYIGLMKAANNFDPDKGVKFITYAFNYIRSELWKEVKAARAIKRAFINVELKNVHAVLERLDKDMMIDLKDAIDSLDPRERSCIRMWAQGATPSEMAGTLGYKSKQGADLLRSRTCEKLKGILTNEYSV
jgi:RNA polymerase sigma factor (sigma-70 family)